MRLIVRNVVLDPRFARLRHLATPGKVVRRPYVGGRPLGPNAQRTIERDHLTKSVLLELSGLVSSGVCLVTAVGGRRAMSPADLDRLQKRMFPAPPPAVVEPQADFATSGSVGDVAEGTPDAGPASTAVPTAGDPEEGPEAHTEADMASAEGTAGDEDSEAADEEDKPVADPDIAPDPAPPLDLEQILDPIEEPERTPEEFEVPEGLEERLSQRGRVTNDELRSMLAMLGGKVAGKNKSTLVSDIIEGLSADVDPVVGNKVLDFLIEVEKE